MTTDKEKLSGYFHCDMAVRRDQSLTDISKLIFGDLAYFYFLREGKCIATNSFFSDKYGKSEGTISNAISALVKRGYIKRYLDEYKNRTIFINRTAFSNANNSDEPNLGGGSETVGPPAISSDNQGPIMAEDARNYDYTKFPNLTNFYNNGQAG